MKRAADIALEESSMGTLVELTSVFEGLASMKISQIKDQVIQATEFYDKLWGIYSQIRVGGQFSFGRTEGEALAIDKELYIIVTAEGGFSGDIDLRLVRLMLKTYEAEKCDIVVIGHHGALQLAQQHVSYSRYFKLPDKDRDINVEPIVKIIRQYKSTRVFYQQYISLMVQDIKRIDLSSAIADRGTTSESLDDTITESNYIFEPSTLDVVAHLERSMMSITMSQLILESKLAQYAARFQAMRMSHTSADDSKAALHTDFNRAKRAVKDQRLKEIINGLKITKGMGA
jgi:F-type H+-transporting ATPase subunit gamma